MKEQILQRLGLLKAETMTKLNIEFREKVQLEEKLKEAEGSIQYGRGYMDCLTKVAQDIDEIYRFRELEGVQPIGEGDESQGMEVMGIGSEVPMDGIHIPADDDAAGKLATEEVKK